MAARMEFLRVEEIGEKAESGATEPYFCRLSDDQLYFAKGRSALPRGLIAEVVCAVLGRAFGLPIPDIAVAELNGGLLSFNSAASASLGGGPVFASRYRENLIQADRKLLDKFDATLLRKIFLFDYWIRNSDRTGTIYGGNSNLFYDVVSNDIIVIDHNLAFEESFDSNAFLKFHICRDFWIGSGAGVLDRPQFMSEMKVAQIALAQIDESLPEEWLESEPNMIENITSILDLKDTEEFWELLS